MKYVFNRENEPWIRPWEIKQFDDLYNRDERFFSIIIKGLISWLNRNIVLYNESINHFIFNTGSSYLYMESNGYEYNLSETTGEDTIYMKLPRCILEIEGIDFPMEELTSPYSRGNYERRSGNQLQGFNAEIRRLPIELSLNLRYYLSNFNETIVLLQELIDKIIFQQYYNVTYLGQVIQCSIEFPGNVNPEINKIDMTSPDPNQRNITLNIKICTNYPLINTRTEIPTDKIIVTYGHELDLYNYNYESDKIDKGEVLNDDIDEFNAFVNNINSKDDIDEINKMTNEQNAINNAITENDTNNDNIIDENDINENNEEDIRNIIEEYDKNGDGQVDKLELINKFDLNNNGVIDADDINNILERIKYENNDLSMDLAESCHYRIDYRDIALLIRLSNIAQENIFIDYDNLTNKIYVTNNETGDVEEVELEKYKIKK